MMRTTFLKIAVIVFGLVSCIVGQESAPEPSAPRSIKVPSVRETKLPNGLRVAVVEKTDVPLVTIQLLVKNGAFEESDPKAGLADLTATMLTKGTTTKTATQIAEEVEFLGGSINSGAGWNSSFVSLTVTSDKFEQAMSILADVVLRPKFADKELELLKSQSLDSLTYNLKQPSFLANYVASKYSLGEHPAGGTPTSIGSITSADIRQYHAANYRSDESILIFTGDVPSAKANAATKKYFGGWKKLPARPVRLFKAPASARSEPAIKNILVVDLPKSGQESVTYAKPIFAVGRKDAGYYDASVLNSILGGGYSSRLNLEIRIKRGLSYGAGSGFSWRGWKTNFTTRTQTKNESAPEVTELVLAEMRKLTNESVADGEIVPRKSALTGNFGRSLESTLGLAGAVADLYSFGIPASELNSYSNKVNGVSDLGVKAFAAANLMGGDVIIAGDYSIFKADLAKRFPGVPIKVVSASDLDLNKLDQYR